MSLFHRDKVKILAALSILLFLVEIILFRQSGYDIIALTSPEVLVVDGNTRVNINYGNLQPLHKTITAPVKVENAYNAILHLPHVAKDIEVSITESTLVLPGFCNIAFGEKYDLHFYKNGLPTLHAIWHPDGCPFVYLKKGDIRKADVKGFVPLMEKVLNLTIPDFS